MVYHVAKTGSDQGKGTQQDPFLTINSSFRCHGRYTVIVREGKRNGETWYKGLRQEKDHLYGSRG